MITEVENTMTLTGNRALVTEQATQNGSDPALGVRRPENYLFRFIVCQ